MTAFTYYTPAACNEGDFSPIEICDGKLRTKAAKREADRKQFDQAISERYRTAIDALKAPERSEQVDLLISLGSKSHKVQMRDMPCNCGCKGSDPWHARNLKRKIRNIQPIDPSVTDSHTLGDRVYTEAVIALGEIKTPWGFEPVRLIASYRSGSSLVWGDWQKDPNRCLIG